MALQQTITVMNTMDSAYVNGEQIRQLFSAYPGIEVLVQKVEGEKGSTEFVKITIPGSEGKLNGAARLLLALSAVSAESAPGQAGSELSLMQTGPLQL